MKTHDLIVAILAMLAFLLLSIPYQAQFGYWAELPLAWAAYALAGAALAVYVVYRFLQVARRIMAEPGETEGRKEDGR